MLVNRTLANVPLVVAFLCIAETAMALAVEGRKRLRIRLRGRVWPMPSL